MSGGRFDGTRRATRAGLAALVAGLVVACSLAFPANQVQCSTDGDCAARGAAFAGSVCVANACVAREASAPDAHVRHDASSTDARPDGARTDAADAARPDGATTNDWACLGHVRFPEAGPGHVTLTVPYVNLVSSLPIPGIVVQACQRLDPACSEPLTEAGVTNDAGTISLSLPSGYNGYLLSLWDASLPSLVYIDPPVFKNTVEPPEDLLSNVTAASLAAALGEIDGSTLVLSPEKGIVFIGAIDCNGSPAAGVRFTLSPAAPGSLEVYLVNGLPSLTATMTDPTGNAGLVNVPVGPITVTSTLAATGQTIGTVDGFSEAGKFSFLQGSPDPSSTPPP